MGPQSTVEDGDGVGPLKVVMVVEGNKGKSSCFVKRKTLFDRKSLDRVVLGALD